MKRYGDLPNVKCFLSQIDQVFMNLLTNAIFAMKDYGTLTITTEHQGDHVVLRLRIPARESHYPAPSVSH